MTPRTCLNCGTEVTDKFCPHCGQSAGVPEKINNKTFGKSLAMSFARLNPGFFNTLVKLSYKPWEVIRDYIHGKQVPYSHPVSMLIQLTLYTSFIIMFIEGILEIDLVKFDRDHGEDPWWIRTLTDSTVVRVLWFSIPLIGAVYLAYWNFGSRRFSFSEYIIAALYLIISMRIFSFIFTPVNFIYFNGEADSVFNISVIFIIGIIFGTIIIFKAFPIASKWKSAVVFIWFLVLALLFYLVYSMFFQFMYDIIVGNNTENWLQRYFDD